MKKLIFAAALALVFASPVFAATETEIIVTGTRPAACKGDAVRANPPVPNYPTHIRNVVWRNTRAMCLQALSRTNDGVTFNTGKETVPGKIIQPNK